MNADWTLVLLGWLGLAAGMGALWLWQRRSGDAGIVDVGWSAGLGVMALLYLAGQPGWWGRRLLVAALVCLWAFRLAGYLLRDRIGKEQEDRRYARLRRQWGERAQLYFFFLFQVQAVLDVLLSLAFLPAMSDPRPGFGWRAAAGVAIWVVAIGGESIADRQLERFRSDPANRGKVCQQGLWRYSRHPNYFFEWVHWWAYVALGFGLPGFWLTLLGPALMLFFLLKVTGVPPAEASSLESRGEAYREYQRTTNKFFPGPRKEP